jgi:DNA-binding beta-propeller fold protein YncE
MGVAVDLNGNIFVADAYNDSLRRISPKGVVSTVAGGGRPGFIDDSAALFDTPCGIVVAPDGTIIVADAGNDRLRAR